MSTVLVAVAAIAGVYLVVGAYAWFANRQLAPELEAEARELLARRENPLLPRSPRPQATRVESIAFLATLVGGYAAIFFGAWLQGQPGSLPVLGWIFIGTGSIAFVVRIAVAIHVRRRFRRETEGLRS